MISGHQSGRRAAQGNAVAAVFRAEEAPGMTHGGTTSPNVHQDHQDHQDHGGETSTQSIKATMVLTIQATATASPNMQLE